VKSFDQIVVQPSWVLLSFVPIVCWWGKPYYQSYIVLPQPSAKLSRAAVKSVTESELRFLPAQVVQEIYEGKRDVIPKPELAKRRASMKIETGFRRHIAIEVDAENERPPQYIINCARSMLGPEAIERWFNVSDHGYGKPWIWVMGLLP
jgi:hypothetical protein